MRGPVLVWSFWEGPGRGSLRKAYPSLLWAYPYAVGEQGRIYGGVDVEEMVEVACRVARANRSTVCIAPLYVWGDVREEAGEGYSGRFARLAGRMAVVVHPAVLETPDVLREKLLSGEQALDVWFTLAGHGPARSPEELFAILKADLRMNAGVEVDFFLLPVEPGVVVRYLQEQRSGSRGAEATPVVVGPVTGWRLWVVQPQSTKAAPHRLRLAARMSDRVWPVRRPMRARHGDWCWSPELLEDPWAMENCRCGLYAMNCVRGLAEMPDLQQRVLWYLVVGAVALWGVVYRHERGYRAQYGYPQQPLVVVGPKRDGVRRIAEALSQNYGVQFLSTTDAEHALWLLAQQQQHAQGSR
jgi:hypothetical protein